GPNSRLLRSEKPLCVLQDVAYSPESVCFDGWLADCPDDTEFETLAAGDYILTGSSYLEVFVSL
ncbi:hypothetical protein ARMSODRAFT_957948, partial [Armillaria solidipes]